MKKYIISILIIYIFLFSVPFSAKKTLASDMSVGDFVNLLITIGVIPPEKIPGVNSWLASQNLYTTIPGIIKKHISTIPPNGCGYCFTSDDGKYNCVLMTGKAFPINSASNLVATNLDKYVGKKVILTANRYNGASTVMCPIILDVNKIEIVTTII